MIPSNIDRDHIVKAIQQIEQQGIPPDRQSTKFSLIFGGKLYPPKYVVSLANIFANGEELRSSEFTGGVHETNPFLERRGFKIVRTPSSKPSGRSLSKIVRASKRREKKHDERCPECKKTIESMLREAYGTVESNYRFEAGTKVDDYSNSPFRHDLRKIFSALQEFRGFIGFVKTANLPRCDFFCSDAGFMVEFDETQHFTLPRKIALQKYPNGLELGFSIKKWIRLCEDTNAKDNTPPFRDEQRAWYDTLRDFLPPHQGLKPTVRLCAKDMAWCSLDSKNSADVAVFRNIVEGTRAKTKNWVATVLLQSGGKYSNSNRLEVLAQVVERVSDQTDRNGVMLFPGGWFSARNQKARSLYEWAEKNVADILNKQRGDMIACVGIDGRKTDEWAKDQIGAAISKKGLIALGRKFFATDKEKEYIEPAQDHRAKEEGYSRIFDLNGKTYFLCACYDSFGLKKRRIPNFGVDVVLDLVHGFYPKGEGNSGDVYFARHGFAGSSKHWGCPVFGAAVFFHREIPPKWPSGVYWNQGNYSTQTWRYDDNPMRPAHKVEWRIKEGSALVRIYGI